MLEGRFFCVFAAVLFEISPKKKTQKCGKLTHTIRVLGVFYFVGKREKITAVPFWL